MLFFCRQDVDATFLPLAIGLVHTILHVCVIAVVTQEEAGMIALCVLITGKLCCHAQ